MEKPSLGTERIDPTEPILMSRSTCSELSAIPQFNWT